MMCSRLEEEQVNNNTTTTVVKVVSLEGRFVKRETLPDQAPIAKNKFGFEMVNGCSGNLRFP